jgi:hypothetical protein
MCRSSDEDGSRKILDDSITVKGELKALESHEALANLGVRRRIDMSSLGIAEEVV